MIAAAILALVAATQPPLIDNLPTWSVATPTTAEAVADDLAPPPLTGHERRILMRAQAIAEQAEARAERAAAHARAEKAERAAAHARTEKAKAQAAARAAVQSPVPDPNGYGAFALRHFAEFGWSRAEYLPLVRLWNKESGVPGAGTSAVTWRPTADNPTSTAHGIAQFLDSTWALVGGVKTDNPQLQILYGLRYVHSAYGTPSAALAFHQANNWY